MKNANYVFSFSELMAHLDELARIVNKFAEYAEEKLVKARSYEKIWADLV